MSVGAATGDPRARPLSASLVDRLRSLGYTEPGKRDLRLDFLRGLAIAAMVVDHISGATRGLLSHTLTLYRGSVGMGLAFAALYLWTDRSAGLGLDNPVEAIVGIATLHHSFHGSDVLVMYTLLLAISPLIFYLWN
jgi:hypothetical protein